MHGIQYVMDEKGKKTGVLIDLKEHGELWEDFYDTTISVEREHEPRESLKQVKKRLSKNSVKK